MSNCAGGNRSLQVVIIEVVSDAIQESDEWLCSTSRSCDVKVSWAPGGCTAAQESFEGNGAKDCIVAAGDNMHECVNVVCN